MTSLLLFIATNNDLFLLFWNTIFLLYWNTASRAGLWKYFSNIKGTIRDQACSAATPTTTAGLLITFDSLPRQQRVNHAPAVGQVNHKPTVWPNTQRKLSLYKRANIFINAEVQWPLPIKSIMHSTVSRQDSVPQLQKFRLIHTIKIAGTGKAQGKCWPLQENIWVCGWTPPGSSVPWSAGQGKRPVPLSVCECSLVEHSVYLSPSNTRQKLASLF